MDDIKRLIEKLDEKIDNIKDDVNEQKIVIARIDVGVEEHVRRSNLADENMALIRQDMKPLQRHVNYVQGGAKLVGLVGVIVGIVVGVLKILGTIH